MHSENLYSVLSRDPLGGATKATQHSCKALYADTGENLGISPTRRAADRKTRANLAQDPKGKGQQTGNRIGQYDLRQLHIALGLLYGTIRL